MSYMCMVNKSICIHKNQTKENQKKKCISLYINNNNHSIINNKQITTMYTKKTKPFVFLSFSIEKLNKTKTKNTGKIIVNKSLKISFLTLMLLALFILLGVLCSFYTLGRGCMYTYVIEKES